MEKRLMLIMQEAEISAYIFSKRLGFKRPDALYKVLDGSTKNPGVDLARAVKKAFPNYMYEWILDGIGEKYQNAYGDVLKLANDKDDIIAQQNQRLITLEVALVRANAIIDSLTGSGKKFKGVSIKAKLDLRIQANIVSMKDDMALMAIGSFDNNVYGMA